jgi:hypothetical protein
VDFLRIFPKMRLIFYIFRLSTAELPDEFGSLKDCRAFRAF